MKTKNIPLLIGLALPIIFIIIISLVIFVPSLTVNPQHNFIYVADNTTYYSYPYDSQYQHMYKIEGGKVVLDPVPLPVTNNPSYASSSRKVAPDLFLYDVKDNTSHQVSLDEANTFSYDPGPSSPDGYLVTYEYANSGIFELFGSDRSSNGYVVSKGNGKKKLSGLVNLDQYGSQNFRLIGWVK